MPSIVPGGQLEGSPAPVWTAPIAPAPAFAAWPGYVLPTPSWTFSTSGKLLEFHPQLLVSEAWIDNFFQTATNRKTDFRTVVGPGGSLQYNGPSTTAGLQGNAGLTYDTAASVDFHIFPVLSGFIRQSFGPRFTVTVTDSYVRNNNPAQADIFGLNTQRTTFSQNLFSATASYQFDQFSLQAFYGNSLYTSGGANGTNTVSNLFGGSGSVQITVRDSAQLSYTYYLTNTKGTSAGSSSGETSGSTVTASYTRQLTEYSNAGVSASFVSNNTPLSTDEQLWNVSLFATYALPSTWSLSGSLGYSQLISNEQATTGGISANINASYSFGQATAAVGIFSGFRQTGLTGQNFGLVQTIGVVGSIGYQFTPTISAQAQAYFNENNFTGSGNDSSTPNQANLGAYVSLIWQLSARLSALASYSYSRSSNAAGSLSGPGNISVNTVTVGLQASF